MQQEIGVIGGGSWGTALAHLAAKNGYSVCIYAIEQEVVSNINENNENTLYLSGHKLDKNVTAKNLTELNNCKEVNFIWSVPTQFSRRVAADYKETLNGKCILIATKGIEISTGELIISVLKSELDSCFAILSGPSFAKEVAGEKPTAVSIASNDTVVSEMWQKALSNNYFRAYASDDVNGVEVGGAMKNVIAIATGLCDGLGFGHNARAAIITRGLAEIARLGVKMGGKPETFMGLSGMGDLVLTCTGDLSRNRQAGLKLAEGLSIEQITEQTNSVAEGVYTAKAAYELSQKIKIEMPITEEIYKIIYEGKNPYKSVADLMNRPLRNE